MACGAHWLACVSNGTTDLGKVWQTTWNGASVRAEENGGREKDRKSRCWHSLN